MTRFLVWLGFRRKFVIVLAFLSFSVIRTCIAETLIKLLVGLRFTFPATTTRVWAPFICQVSGVYWSALLLLQDHCPAPHCVMIKCHSIRHQTTKNSCTRTNLFRRILCFQIVLYVVWDGGSYKKFRKKLIFVTFIGAYWVWVGGVWGYCSVNAWIIHSRWVKYDP